MSNKPKILYLPTQSHTNRVFTQETFQRFQERFEVALNLSNSNYTSEKVADEVKGKEYEGLVTGWGTPILTESVLENADQLKVIAHSAGSVKAMLAQIFEKYIIPKNISVFSANHAIAYNVAESTIGYMIMTSRRWLDQAHATRDGKWHDRNIPSNGQYLRGSVVGVVSASKVGREVIKLLKPFDLKILVYDPYLSDWEAGRLDIEKVNLEELFSRSDFVTVHAPSIPQTWGLIGEKQLRLLKDGAILVNTSRGKVIDPDALLKEAQTGRILVTLDVTEPEPLPADHPLRKLPNVIITPHISGAGHYGYFKIGELTLQALEDFFAGRTPQGAIRYEEYARLA